MSKKEFWQKMKTSKTMHLVKIISENAAFALLLSIILFGFEMYDNIHESKEITKTLDSISANLVEVQSSLSTRYLGEFPDFVHDIDSLYGQANPGDTIIILEDVLFYGIYSAPVDFYKACLKLFDLAANGSPVTISYYKPYGMAYNFMLPEMLLTQKNYNNYRHALGEFKRRNQKYKTKRMEIIDSCVNANASKAETDRRLALLVDECFGDIIDKQVLEEQKGRMSATASEKMAKNESLSSGSDEEEIRARLLEKYFAKSREENPKAFQLMVEKYRRPTMRVEINESSTRIQKETQTMCLKMDSIRLKYLGAENTPVYNLKYSNFKQMFTEMTKVMEDTYHLYPHIKLVPIDNFVSVRSWLICDHNGKSKAIMAFPSRYSSSEIGFYTIDKSTKNYIITMQKGIELERQ